MSVPWTETAKDRLADIYVGLPLDGQRELALKVEEINTLLAADPQELGESRSGNRRIWYAGPLIVTFRLLAGGRAEVLYVSPNKPRRAGG